MDQAEIQFLYISIPNQQRLSRIVNRCWFCSHISTVSNHEEEITFFKSLPTRQQNNQMFDAVFADFTEETQLPVERQVELIDFLRAHRRPLITLTSVSRFFALADGTSWLHLSLPVADLEHQTEAVNDAITNFWFNLPEPCEAAD